MHDKVEPRSPPRLAKAVKLSPKKDIPAKTVEDRKEKHEKSVQDPTPLRLKSRLREWQRIRLLSKKKFPWRMVTRLRNLSAGGRQDSQNGVEVPIAEPSPDRIVTAPAVEPAAESSSEPVVEEPKAEATTTESLI